MSKLSNAVNILDTVTQDADEVIRRGNPSDYFLALEELVAAAQNVIDNWSNS